jgi:ribose transport system permease protein
MRSASWKALRGSLARFESGRVLISIVIVVAAMAILSDNFLTLSNLTSVLSNQSIIGVIVIGELLTLLTGGIDISVGSVFGFAGTIAAVLLARSVPAGLCMILGVAGGLVVGFLNGILITRVRITPFIVTLGMLGVVRGCNFILTGAKAVNISNAAYLFLDAGTPLFIPMPILVLLFIGILAHVFLKRTVTGGRIYAVGGDEQAARMLGMKVQNIKLLVYTLSGTLAAIAGVEGAAKVTSSYPLAGTGYEFDVIAAVIIGGALMEGGKGTVLGSILGAIFIGILRNSIVLLGVSPYWQQASSGLVIIAVIMASSILARSRESRA